jgi:selenocysteine lyase/cysteine desulfurase
MDGGRHPVAMLAVDHAIAHEVRSLFSPEGAYLNTATYGLPPRTAFHALERAADEWRHGRCGFDGWDVSVGRARAAFARLADVDPTHVAIGSQVSPFVGLVAASLPPGSRVLWAEGDFTSLLFPFLVQEERGVRVRSVPLERLAEAIDAGTDVVACSAVQSADGALADLEALAAAADHHGATVVLDTTQAMDSLPIDCARFAVTICGGYKWLLNPRGTAFMTIQPQAAERIAPHAAGWYAAAEPIATLYGGPLRLAADARRFDHSPAWLSWVGAAPALELLVDIGPERIHTHDVALAERLRAGLGLEPAASAIVAVATGDAAAERLHAAGVMAAGRAGRLRLSCHLYNDEGDVDRALEALAG